MIYLRNTSQNRRRESTLFKLNIKAVHNCSAIRDASSIADKDTKNKQNKMEEHAGKLGLPAASCFFPSFPLFHCCAWVRLHKKAAMLQITVFVIWHEFDVWREEFVNFWSFPTRVCQLKFAVWRPLKKRKKLALVLIDYMIPYLWGNPIVRRSSSPVTVWSFKVWNAKLRKSEWFWLV